MKYILWVALLLCIAAGSGCTALHMPQSEIMLFEPGPDSLERLTGVSISTAQLNSGIRQHGLDMGRNSGRWFFVGRTLWGMSYKRGSFFSKKLAGGFALGAGGVGLDLTFRRGKQYLTVSGNAAQNFELIVQQPIVQRSTSGLGIGVFFRRERHGITRCEQYVPCYLDDFGQTFSLTHIGIRFGHYIDDPQGWLRTRLRIAYVPELKGGSIGLGIGIQARR